MTIKWSLFQMGFDTKDFLGLNKRLSICLNHLDHKLTEMNEHRLGFSQTFN